MGCAEGELSNLNNPKTTLEIIDAIRAAPALHLGGQSVTRLSAFLDGYRTAHGFSNDGFDYDKMVIFIESKYHAQDCSHWSTLLLHHAATEQDAFAAFFEVFDEFIAHTKSGIDVNPMWWRGTQ